MTAADKRFIRDNIIIGILGLTFFIVAMKIGQWIKPELPPNQVRLMPIKNQQFTKEEVSLLLKINNSYIDSFEGTSTFIEESYELGIKLQNELHYLQQFEHIEDLKK